VPVSLDPEQVLLQLGLAGALLAVVYKLGMRLIDVFSVAEAERTKVIAGGFSAITGQLAEHGKQLVELHTKVDEHLSTKEAIRQALDEVTGQHELAPLPSDDRDLELAPPRPFAKARAGTKGGT
jgi:hypothetical protein